MTAKVAPEVLKQANEVLSTAMARGTFNDAMHSRSISQLLAKAQSLLKLFPGVRAAWTAGKLRAVRA